MKRHKGTKYACTGRTSKLVKQMFNVNGVELTVTGQLRGSEKRQTIMHFGQPNSIMDKRDCGIPVRVNLPQLKKVVHTRLVPQWRFGQGMRTKEVNGLMRGKTTFHLTERTSGNLVLEFY